jgi:zinc transport system ATP-binding protein
MQTLLEQVNAPQQLLDSPVDAISGGELQRVLLGLALQPEPELLLLDEPAAGIDFQDQEKFYDLIGRVNREQKTTILLVSHDVSMVSERADHVLCLKDGRIHCQGPPSQVLTGEMLAQTFGPGHAVYEHRHAP